MLEFCRAERSTQFQIGAKLPFCDRHRLLFIGPRRGRSNLFRMISLYIYRTERLWNDIVAKKPGGVGWAPQLKLSLFAPVGLKGPCFGRGPCRMSTCTRFARNHCRMNSYELLDLK